MLLKTRNNRGSVSVPVGLMDGDLKETEILQSVGFEQEWGPHGSGWASGLPAVFPRSF